MGLARLDERQGDGKRAALAKARTVESGGDP